MDFKIDSWAAHPHFQQFQALAEKQLPVMLLGASPLLNSNFVVTSEGGLEPLTFDDERTTEDWSTARAVVKAQRD